MPKKKITEKELDEQSTIIQRLTGAGWKQTERGTVFKTANMEYQNKTMQLEVDYGYEKDSFYFSLYDHEGKGIDLIIYFEDKLKQLLDTVISFQDEISPNNYREYIRRILSVCSSTYLDMGDETVPLVDDLLDSQLPYQE
jgi:hypothetical protein